MADQVSNSSGALSGKGKGKAVDQHGDTEMHDDEMDLDDDEEDEDFDEEDGEPQEEEEDEDDMDEIDLDNIVDSGRRTRGKVIDFAKAAEQTKNEPFPGADEDEDEDEDYEAPGDEGIEH